MEIRPKTISSSRLKSARPAAASRLVAAEDRQERAVQQRAGEQRRDDRGRLAVGVGQPGVQRRQAHLGAVADQEQQKRRLEPEWVEAVRRGPPGRRRSGGQASAVGSRPPRRGRSCPAAPGRCRPNRSAGISRWPPASVMAVEVDQRRAGQRGGLDGHPQQAQVLAHGHQRHGGQEQAAGSR